MKLSPLTRSRATAAALVGAGLLATVLAGCTSSGGSSSASGPYSAAKGCTKIGVLLPESDTSARWEANDHPDLVAAIKQYLPHAQAPDVTNANNSSDTQISQAEADLTKGDCILIVAPQDSQKSATIVEAALKQHVPVIAYDRLIQDKNTAFYVSFDNQKVGQLQGQYIADHYQQYVSANGNNNLVMINGSKTDNNALLFAKGAHSVLDPLVTAGKLKLAYETFTPDWNNSTAQSEMQGALVKTPNIAVAYVANDGMAGTVIAALKANHLAGKVLVTGQDATPAGFQNILLGYQSMTVYKAISKEANAAAALAAALSNGTDTASFTNGATTATQDGGNIPSVLEVPVAVDKSNIASTVLADGFVTKAQICVGVPAGTDGIC
ncbi:MAG: substrate-binding domain-containing protein [Chloroflexota bacterium]|nr:substrate-binding domain-containing protein [Chloroflexota bacterium]